ncbi:MAG: ATP-binding protein [Pseudomonadota bacterium]
MSTKSSKSLKSLIFRHEIAILLLITITALTGGATAYFWQQNSAESLRINDMFYFTEQVRGEMYAQIQEMIRARVLEDSNAYNSYAQYSRSISELFNELRRRSISKEEDLAIQELNLSYREIQRDMNNVFNDPYIANRLSRIQLLDPQFAQRMVGKFEQHYLEFRAILKEQHEQLDITLENWTKLAPFAITIPIVIVLMIVLYTRQVMRNEFIKPIGNIMRGAEEISHGNLSYKIEESGVAEVANLTEAINKMAEEIADNRDAIIENEKQAALGSLVPVVAHNIRNPLASIRAMAQLLEHTDNKDEIIESKNEIITTIDRLGRWVSSLVSYLHPLKPNRIEVYPVELINAALSLISIRIDEKQIKVTKRGWENNLPLSADPDLMEQALFSLLSNAVDATPKQGEIKIALANLGDQLEIHIHDSGPGLSFEPKPDNLEPGPSTKRLGTGLGIPIAYKICEKHDWDLKFDVEKGKGTMVIISAPLQQKTEVNE